MSRETTHRKIGDFFNVPARFLRSTNLEKDFHDPKALDFYTLTPFVQDAFQRILEGAVSGSGRRAWRITGDYGVGKSSFALFLAQYLSDPKSPTARKILKQSDGRQLPKVRQMIPVLVTGERGNFASAIACGFAAAFGSSDGRKVAKARAAFLALTEKARRSGSSSALMELLDGASAIASREQAGIVLIVDELGKFLEHAANNPESEDIYLLQTIAERAVRSAESPFIFVGLLHQGFHAYAEKLPHSQRHEWEKIAGRFEELVFDQPLTHTFALAARALSLKHDLLPKHVANESRSEAKKSLETGWFPRGLGGEALSLYPLHPLLLSPLIRFFARFGQHERSLFTFLLSNEPFGLQAFAQREAGTDCWYRLPDFFDYVRTGIGHRLSGESYRSSWIRLIELVDRAGDLPKLELDIVKCVAILNLLDAEDLLATDKVVQAAVAGTDRNIIDTIRTLVEKGLLFRRGAGGGYRLWGASSINLRKAFEEAYQEISDYEHISEQLIPYLDGRPIAARRHYLETGTLRYFDVKYAPFGGLEKVLDERPGADGAVVVVLPQTEAERAAARQIAKRASRDDVLVLVPGVLSGLGGDLKEAQAWAAVLGNAELAADPFASAEADRQHIRASGRIGTGLEEAIGIRSRLAETCEVYRAGERLHLGTSRTLAPIVSATCDTIFTKAPKVVNELVNRNTLSSAAAAARMRLIEGMFNSPDLPLLGIDEERAPPEKSMYLSVLAAGNVHRTVKGRHFVDEPSKEADPLRLRPAISEIMEMLEEAEEARVAVDDVVGALRRKPFGVRDGMAPLLLAIVLSTRAHEIAVYEKGTFLHNFGAADFLRLTKDPATFELQLCRVAGVRAEVFRRLLDCFAAQPTGRQSELLDVVTPLCRFAAQLPEFTRRSSALDAEATRVRDALLTGTDPSALLFKQLPAACGIEPFDSHSDRRRDKARIEKFVSSLHQATDRLKDAYKSLLTNVVSDVARALDAGEGKLDRAKIAARASRVALAAREGRLRAFAQRLRDPGLSEDGWIEALASFVVSKPPSRWAKIDTETWKTDIDGLGATFLRVEAAAYASGPEPSRTAFRIGITRSDGSEIARVVEIPQEGEAQFQASLRKAEKALPTARDERLAVLYRMLWEIIGPSDSEASGSDEVPSVDESQSAAAASRKQK